jgi:hypothetical protein
VTDRRISATHLGKPVFCDIMEKIDVFPLCEFATARFCALCRK